MSTNEVITEALNELDTQAGAGDRHDLVIAAATKALAHTLLVVGAEINWLNRQLESVTGDVSDRGAIRVYNHGK